MPWKETCVQDERVAFIVAWKHGGSMTGLCEAHGISRKTGYKWVERYEAGGWDALVDASRAPHEPAHRMPAATAAAIIALRRAHRELGPKKLRAVLARQHPEQAWPAPSAIGDLLRRRPHRSHGRVGQARHPPRTHRPRRAAEEWPARAHARHAQGADHAPARRR